MAAWIDIDRLAREVRPLLSEERWVHTQGVMATASALAARHGVDEHAAVTAAVLHDCAKGMGRQQLLSAIEQYQVSVDDEDLEHPAILHGPVGAAIARAQFGVQDPLVLDAIAHHTVGHAQPSGVLMVLMAADFTEPSRHWDGIDEIRRLIQENLPLGLAVALEQKRAHVVSKGKEPHSRVHETIASLRAMAEAAA